MCATHVLFFFLSDYDFIKELSREREREKERRESERERVNTIMVALLARMKYYPFSATSTAFLEIQNRPLLSVFKDLMHFCIHSTLKNDIANLFYYIVQFIVFFTWD